MVHCLASYSLKGLVGAGGELEEVGTDRFINRLVSKVTHNCTSKQKGLINLLLPPSLLLPLPIVQTFQSSSLKLEVFVQHDSYLASVAKLLGGVEGSALEVQGFGSRPLHSAYSVGT